jgi:hypothetical protein
VAARNPDWRKTAATSALCPGIAGQHPYQLSAQPLKIGRQENVGNARAGMCHELPSKLRGEREVFVQAPRQRRGGLVVASINSGEE